VDLPEPPSTNIVYAKILGKYPMRTARKVVNNEAIALSFESDELYERIADGKDAEEALQTFKEGLSSLPCNNLFSAVKTIDDSDGIYPSVTFLGTGSACPAKYRNVSGHWLQLNERKSVMVDCGEGTYGQLKVFAGPERIVDVLLNLSAIFITHAHLDHFSGVYTLIQRRWEAFHEKGNNIMK
jgi:ribonuclease Z